ncbi:MAG: sulfite exporter TauE/SafE family protein, partial [Bacteroidia bacterium]|nr:sulfite exporter TauE/SafE family protein [Bacteroidia bacterium]
MSSALWFILFGLGLVGGFLAGLLGIGGGLIYIIILQYVFKEYVQDTYEITRFILANSIFATLFASLSSIVRQIKQKTFYGSALLWVGVPSAIVSMSISYFIQQSNWYDKRTFLVVFSAILVLTIVKTLKAARHTQKKADENKVFTELAYWKYALTGCIAGIVSPLTGLGGGIVIVPMLSTLFNLSVKRAVNISVSSIIVSAFFNTLVYMYSSPSSAIEISMHTGYIAWGIVLPVILGVLIASYLGTMIAYKLEGYSLQYIFAGFLG